MVTSLHTQVHAHTRMCSHVHIDTRIYGVVHMCTGMHSIHACEHILAHTTHVWLAPPSRTPWSLPLWVPSALVGFAWPGDYQLSCASAHTGLRCARDMQTRPTRAQVPVSLLPAQAGLAGSERGHLAVIGCPGVLRVCQEGGQGSL